MGEEEKKLDLDGKIFTGFIYICNSEVILGIF